MTTSGTPFDVIVVGVGGMGSAALYHLARRGARVLGLERFDIPHDQGSSHGVNRIFRLAYYEGSGYVPLMRRALDLWNALQAEAGERLVVTTGSIDAGPVGGEVFDGSRRSCVEHDLAHDVLNGDEVHQRFPGYRLPASFQAVFQPEGGFVLSERAIVAHVAGALDAGGEVHARETVTGWDVTPAGGVVVTTNLRTYEAPHLVITAGPWAAELLPVLDPLVVAERQALGWFHPRVPASYAPSRFPVFNLEVEEGRYYGFPVFGVPGFKIGRYHHLDEVTGPGAVDRSIRPEDEEVLRVAVRRYFPDANGPTMSMKTCLFTNSTDEHFIIDRAPGLDQVTVAAGFSGHGYKFCSVVGEILADLALTGSTSHDIELFRLDRFG